MADLREHLEQDLEQKLSSEVLSYNSPEPRIVNLFELPGYGTRIGSQLWQACRKGDLNTVKEVLETNNIGVNVGRIGEHSLLTLAAKYKQIRLVNFLLNQPGIDISKMNDDAETALSYALSATHNFKDADYEMVHNLIRAGADINKAWYFYGEYCNTALLTAWYKKNQEAANKLIISFGASIELSESLFYSYKQRTDGFGVEGEHVPEQIALSKQRLREYREYIDNAKWLGIGIENLCFQFHAENAISKIAAFLINENVLGQAFNLGRAMMHKRLSKQFPTPAPTPAPMPRSLLFMGNFEDRMRNIGDELSWEKLKEEYNAKHPGREQNGYGLGAMVVYKP